MFVIDVSFFPYTIIHMLPAFYKISFQSKNLSLPKVFIDFLPKKVTSSIFSRSGGREVVQSWRLAELKVLSARRRKGVMGSPTGPSGRHSPIHQRDSFANPLLAEACFIRAHHTVHIPTSSSTLLAAPPLPPQSEPPPPLAQTRSAARNYNQFQSP